MKYKKIIIKQMDEGFRDITSFGSLTFVFLVIALLIFINLKSALTIFIGLLLIEIIGAGIKLIFYKKRPNHEKYSNFIEKIDSGSFPSVHSARVLLIGLSIYSIFSSAILIGLIFLGVFLVGVSRVYLKKHYVIDVIGGYVFGFISWYISNSLLKIIII